MRRYDDIFRLLRGGLLQARQALEKPNLTKKRERALRVAAKDFEFRLAFANARAKRAKKS
jgi:hypothetical protein